MIDAMDALRVLGVDAYSFGYKKNQYTEVARKLAEDNEMCERVVARIQGYEWDSNSIHRLINLLDDTIKPLREIVQQEKDDKGNGELETE